MQVENHHSNTWKNISKCRETGIKIIERKFKDGKQTNLWFDPWINGKSLVNPVDQNNLYQYGGENAKVESIIQNFTWNKNMQQSVSIFKLAIGKIEIDPSLHKDIWFQKSVVKGNSLLKILRNVLKRKWIGKNLFRIKKIVQKQHIVHILSYYIDFQLMTDASNGIKMEKSTAFYKNEPEIIEHIYFNCIYSRNLWSIVQTKLNLNQLQTLQNVKESIQHMQQKFRNKKENFTKLAQF